MEHMRGAVVDTQLLTQNTMSLVILSAKYSLSQEMVTGKVEPVDLHYVGLCGLVEQEQWTPSLLH